MGFWRWCRIINPTEPVFYDYITTGTFKVRLIVSSYENFTDTTYRIIKIEGGNDIYIPNAFTPNGDGINDYFKVSGIGIQSVNIMIYNRWGQNVFQQNGNSPVWNGMNQKTGTNSEAGVYIYIIKVKESNSKLQMFKGIVTLLR